VDLTLGARPHAEREVYFRDDFVPAQRMAFATIGCKTAVDSGWGLMHKTLPFPNSVAMMAGVPTMVPFWGS
jgi:hypothetical protein